MKHRHIAFGIVGLMVGFVLGFFISEATRERPVPGQQGVAQGQEQLPEGHPPIDIEQQLAQLLKHANDEPDHVDAKIQVANLLYDVQRFEEAIPWYEKAIKQQPRNINVNNDLATCYFATGNREKALVLLQESLAIEANHSVALQNLGWFHFQSNNYKEAIRNWERLIEIHPDFPNLEEVKKQLENAKSHERGDHS